MGVACGPGYALIRAQALATGRYPLLSLTQVDSYPRPFYPLAEANGNELFPHPLSAQRREGRPAQRSRGELTRQATRLWIPSLFPPRRQNSFGRKRAEQWWPCARQGHRKFCRSAGKVRTPVGQKIPARGSARFAGQRPCAAKKPFCRLDLLLLFYQEKRRSLRGGERRMFSAHQASEMPK